MNNLLTILGICSIQYPIESVKILSTKEKNIYFKNKKINKEFNIRKKNFSGKTHKYLIEKFN